MRTVPVMGSVANGHTENGSGLNGHGVTNGVLKKGEKVTLTGYEMLKEGEGGPEDRAGQ